MTLRYQVVESFDQGHSKVSELISDKVVFIDCHYVNLDLQQKLQESLDIL